MDWGLIVPPEPGWGQVDWGQAREVRLRPGQTAAVTMKDGLWRGTYRLSPEDIMQAAQALSGHGFAARQEALCQGYLPLPGGHRLGVCGEMGAKGWRNVHSLCVRLAHEVKGAAAGLAETMRQASLLIVGPPGSGKTTLLRDGARLLSESGVQVGIADERGEIAAWTEQGPQLDVGPNTDVITGMEKARALSLLIRTMAPQAVVTDEIGGPEDASALLNAARCGVKVLATAHGRGPEDARERPGLDALFRQGVFGKIAVLSGVGQRIQVMEADP